jgi:ABC-type multidrug transport system ATPase subunit
VNLLSGVSQLTAAVEIIEVSKKYGYLWALKSLSLKIDKSEFVAILGPNGAGKTTLMKIVATHISPSAGTVKIFGKNAFKNGGEVRKQIGFVTHESFLYDELTVEENLLFYAKLFSVTHEKFHDIIEFLNLKRWYRVQVKRLSYGLRKRADIVRALIHDPDLILLDELFAGLDEETCSLLVDYFRNQQAKAVLISSHSIDWAKKLCDRGIFLDKGEIVKDTRF